MGHLRVASYSSSLSRRDLWQDPVTKQVEGKEAKLSHMGHVLAENWHGPILGICETETNGTAERGATIQVLDELQSTHDRTPITPGGDKGYDDGELFRKLESRKIEPHIPLVGEPADPKSVKDRKRLPGIRARRRMKRRMGEVGYELSQKCRKKVEECFGWLKSVAGLGRSRVVGRWKLVNCFKLGRPHSIWCVCESSVRRREAVRQVPDPPARDAAKTAKTARQRAFFSSLLG